MKIKSADIESQGEFVEIDDCNFDPETMELYEPKPAGPTRDEMKAHLTEKGVEFPQNIKGDKLAELYDNELAKAE